MAFFSKIFRAANFSIALTASCLALDFAGIKIFPAEFYSPTGLFVLGLFILFSILWLKPPE
ncbi:MAG: hypothetical protein V1494_05880 [Candidatus Diapherotrites archaeon]